MTPTLKREEFVKYLRETGLKDFASLRGNVGAYVLTRNEGENTEFLVFSLWDSYEDIKAFAGREAEKTRYYPRDKEFLLELEPKVKHYEVAAVL